MTITQIDQNIITWVIERRTLFFDSFFTQLTNMGSGWFIILLTLIIGGLYCARKKWYHIEVLFLVILGQEIIGRGLKYLFARARPEEMNRLVDADGFSFPSGHSLAAASFYGTLIYFIILSRYSSKIKTVLIIPLVLLIVLIGFSRVYLGVHYPSDVLVGFLIGAVWLLAVIRVIPKKNKSVVK